jgi:hypothetical protein
MKQAITNNLTGEVTIVEVPEVQGPVMPELTVDQRRKQAYATSKRIAWADEQLTVDEANQLFLYYRAEGAEARALELQALIATAIKFFHHCFHFLPILKTQLLSIKY